MEECGVQKIGNFNATIYALNKNGNMNPVLIFLLYFYIKDDQMKSTMLKIKNAYFSKKDFQNCIDTSQYL